MYNFIASAIAVFEAIRVVLDKADTEIGRNFSKVQKANKCCCARTCTVQQTAGSAGDDAVKR